MKSAPQLRPAFRKCDSELVAPGAHEPSDSPIVLEQQPGQDLREQRSRFRAEPPKMSDNGISAVLKNLAAKLLDGGVIGYRRAVARNWQPVDSSSSRHALQHGLIMRDRREALVGAGHDDT